MQDAPLKSKMRWLAPATAIFAASCSAPAPECAWIKPIRITQEDILARPTLEQIAAHNRKVGEFCR